METNLKTHPVQVIMTCCAALIYNATNNTARFYYGQKKEALQHVIRDFVMAKMAEHQQDDPNLIPGLKDMVVDLATKTLAENPDTIQNVSDSLLLSLGRTPVSLSGMPVQLTTPELTFSYLNQLMEMSHMLHQEARMRRYTALATDGDVLRQAMERAVANTASQDGADGVSEAMAIIPLKADGSPDLDRLDQYAPGTELYEAIREGMGLEATRAADDAAPPVIEPNRVAGNGTLH
ncbi:hypothetical protein PJWF_00095 [Achromobacter phage JWF]|uniref:hypothetical protein n=1 Tax=Achromobacter phage JWF TaxID=1589748 RepID=UPI000588E0D1|nr:hypothetical protein AXJ13_gp093 [Achromobacter phage JWF]AJD82988.1 hypothetical protein PJWF_00095 [Achromobacter phage JWF]